MKGLFFSAMAYIVLAFAVAGSSFFFISFRESSEEKSRKFFGTGIMFFLLGFTTFLVIFILYSFGIFE